MALKDAKIGVVDAAPELFGGVDAALADVETEDGEGDAFAACELATGDGVCCEFAADEDAS